jgi:hypothetical protein
MHQINYVEAKSQFIVVLKQTLKQIHAEQDDDQYALSYLCYFALTEAVKGTMFEEAISDFDSQLEEWLFSGPPSPELEELKRLYYDEA